MKQLPQQVKIGPVIYEVKQEARTAADSCYGQIIYAESLITLMPGMSAQRQEMTLWHEILHGILTQGGYREQDEQVVDVLAHGLMQVFQDNPELIK